MRFRTWTLLLLATAGCARPEPTAPAPPAAAALGAGPATAPGLHNIVRITDKLYSGSVPEGNAGFATLHALGFQTIISVDGARPDVDRARQHGLRYVHLPVGYDGVPREQALRLARAVRDLPGLVYLHCHHGQHRAPAAAVAARLCLDSDCTAAAALALLKKAGTGEQYKGLYAAVKQYQVLPAAELDNVPAEFPEVAPVPGLVKLMVQVDEHWERLKQIRAAGWKTPPGHPDLDPAHEALLLREALRESAQARDLGRHPAELRTWLVEAETAATGLENALPLGSDKSSAEGAERAYRKVAGACTHCHVKYRDVPK